MSIQSLRQSLGRLAMAGVTVAALAAAAPAQADEYDPQRAGHPLRIAAYAIHPAGALLDYLVFRPVHWVGSWEPIAALFGHKRNLEERDDLQPSNHPH